MKEWWAHNPQVRGSKPPSKLWSPEFPLLCLHTGFDMADTMFMHSGAFSIQIYSFVVIIHELISQYILILDLHAHAS